MISSIILFIWMVGLGRRAFQFGRGVPTMTVKQWWCSVGHGLIWMVGLGVFSGVASGTIEGVILGVVAGVLVGVVWWLGISAICWLIGRCFRSSGKPDENLNVMRRESVNFVPMEKDFLPGVPKILYIADQNKRYGPFTFEQVKARWDSGALSDDALCSTGLTQGWKPLAPYMI